MQNNYETCTLHFTCTLKCEPILCAYVVHIGRLVFQMYCNYKLISNVVSYSYKFNF